MSRHHRALDRKRWAAVRWQVINRDGWRCRSCGKPGRLECDHVKPLEDGGDAWAMGNLQMLCRSCHFRKTTAEKLANLLPDVREWRNRLISANG